MKWKVGKNGEHPPFKRWMIQQTVGALVSKVLGKQYLCPAWEGIQHLGKKLRANVRSKLAV